MSGWVKFPLGASMRRRDCRAILTGMGSWESNPFAGGAGGRGVEGAGGATGESARTSAARSLVKHPRVGLLSDGALVLLWKGETLLQILRRVRAKTPLLDHAPAGHEREEGRLHSRHRAISVLKYR